MKNIFAGIIHLFLLAGLCSACSTRVCNVHIEDVGYVSVSNAYPDDVDAAAFLSVYKEKVDSIRNPVVGHCATFMKVGRPESLLGNWAADAFINKAKSLGYEVDFAIHNVGGIRSTMPEGTISRGNLMDIFPFKNYLSIVTLKGSDLMELFAQIVSTGGECVSHGVKLVMSSDRKLISAKINNKEIKATDLYSIATINYLADGNDRLTAFKKHVKRIDTDWVAFDVVYSVIQELESRNEVVSSKIEGRITIQ